MRKKRYKIALLLLAVLLAGLTFWFFPVQRSFETYVQKAEQSFTAKNYPQAIQNYLKALKNYPDHARVPEILLSVGDIYNFNLDNDEKALKAYQMLTQRFSATRQGRLAFAREAELFNKNDQYQSALLAYQNIIDHFPNDPEIDQVRYQVAMMAAKLGKFEPARRTLMAIIDQDPETELADQILYQLGNIFFIEGSNQQAIQVLTVAIQKFPQSPLVVEMKFSLANAYEEEDQRQEALKLYREIENSYPNHKVIEKKIDKLTRRELLPVPARTLRKPPLSHNPFSTYKSDFMKEEKED